MNTISRLTLALGLLATTLTSNSAEQAKHLNITKLKQDNQVTIDGLLNETIWQQIPVLDQLHQVKPVEFSKPSQKTGIKVAYDSNYLYIAAVLHESDPSLINAGQLIQGRNYDFDDQFQVILDPFNSQRSGYLFSLNPNGIRAEALIDNQNTHQQWTAIWQGEATINDNGWTLEIAIPFKSLSFNPEQDQWGINFVRTISRKGEVIAWSSRGADSSELAPAVAGKVAEIKEIKQGLGLDIKASLTASRTSRASLTDTDISPSLDVFYKPSPDLTVSATFNTDFSATEVDDRVINLSRFSIFLPEKRDFFLQDMDIFEFADLNDNGRPFFSRNIGLDANGQAIDLNVGTKVTGRNDSYSYGILAIQQENQLAEKQELFVGRATANILDESSIGLISTYGNPLTGEGDSLIGTDFNYRNSNFLNNKTLTGGLWYQKSDNAINGSGQSYGANLRYPNDDININFTTATIEENFNPALGFVNRKGIRTSNLYGGFQRRFKDDFWRSYYPWMRSNYVTDLDNRLLSKQFIIYPIGLNSLAGDFLEVGHQFRTEVLDVPFEIAPGISIPIGRHDFENSHIFFDTAKSRVISGQFLYRKGDFFTGTTEQIQVGLNWRPNKHFYIGASYENQDIKLAEGTFTTELALLRTEVAVNSQWSWLTNVQYDNFSDSIGVNSRLRWQPDALSSLSITYNSTDFRDKLISNQRNQNRISIKYSYTFRY